MKVLDRNNQPLSVGCRVRLPETATEGGLEGGVVREPSGDRLWVQFDHFAFPSLHKPSDPELLPDREGPDASSPTRKAA